MPKITKDSIDKSNKKEDKNNDMAKKTSINSNKKALKVTDKKDLKVIDKKELKVADKRDLKVIDKKEPKVADKRDLKVIDKKEPKVADKKLSKTTTKKTSKIDSVIDTIKSMITNPSKNTTKTNEKNAKSKKTTKKTYQHSPTPGEYYDLPYNYNETIVKILAQTPKKLFVYWDVSSADIEKFKTIFGDDFFNTTYPILIIHNEDKNYSFEVDVNDFANSWYINIDDPKCNYSVEYGRKFKSQINILNNNDILKQNINLQNDYLFISNSNRIESPNDHILFEKYNYSSPIKYKNIKTHQISYKNLNNLPLSKNYPYNSKLGISDIYNEIYELDGNQMEILFNLSNPSSGNPSSQNK